MTAPKRVQMTRQRPWRADNPDAVIVARPSRWGNPYRIGDTVVGTVGMGTVPAVRTILGAAMAVRLYGQWLARTPEGREVADAARSALVGRDLACWCKPGDPCHADVLLELANEATS